MPMYASYWQLYAVHSQNQPYWSEMTLTYWCYCVITHRMTYTLYTYSLDPNSSVISVGIYTNCKHALVKMYVGTYCSYMLSWGVTRLQKCLVSKGDCSESIWKGWSFPSCCISVSYTTNIVDKREYCQQWGTSPRVPIQRQSWANIGQLTCEQVCRKGSQKYHVCWSETTSTNLWCCTVSQLAGVPANAGLKIVRMHWIQWTGAGN